MEAAVCVLDEDGIEQVAVAKIATIAGVSEATVYKYFETKENLIGQTLDSAMTQFVEMLERQVRAAEWCRERICRLSILSLQDMARRRNVQRAVNGHLRWAGQYKSTIHEIHRRIARLVEWIFAEGVKEGEISAQCDLVIAGDMLFGALEGAAWRTVLQAEPRPLDEEAFVDAMVDQLLGGIRPAAAT